MKINSKENISSFDISKLLVVITILSFPIYFMLWNYNNGFFSAIGAPWIISQLSLYQLLCSSKLFIILIIIAVVIVTTSCDDFKSLSKKSLLDVSYFLIISVIISSLAYFFLTKGWQFIINILFLQFWMTYTVRWIFNLVFKFKEHKKDVNSLVSNLLTVAYTFFILPSFLGSLIGENFDSFGKEILLSPKIINSENCLLIQIVDQNAIIRCVESSGIQFKFKPLNEISIMGVKALSLRK